MICLVQETGKTEISLKQLRYICQFLTFVGEEYSNPQIALLLISSYVCLKHLIRILHIGTTDCAWWMFDESVWQAKTTWLCKLALILFLLWFLPYRDRCSIPKYCYPKHSWGNFGEMFFFLLIFSALFFSLEYENHRTSLIAV